MIRPFLGALETINLEGKNMIFLSNNSADVYISMCGGGRLVQAIGLTHGSTGFETGRGPPLHPYLPDKVYKHIYD